MLLFRFWVLFSHCSNNHSEAFPIGIDGFNCFDIEMATIALVESHREAFFYFCFFFVYSSMTDIDIIHTLLGLDLAETRVVPDTGGEVSEVSSML